MNGESLDIRQTNLEKLKQVFPELFAENQLDWEKLKATFSTDINFSPERYVLNWAGKAEAFKILQVPTTATLQPQPEESINFDSSENLFIERWYQVLKENGRLAVVLPESVFDTTENKYISNSR